MARTAKKPDVKKLIDRMVKRIVKHFDPEQIILFGSHARGDARADSDVDLLVVMDVEGSRWDKAIEIQLQLDGIRISKDVFVSRPADFAWRKDYVGTIEFPAFTEGKVLYARSPRACHSVERVDRKGRK